MAFKKILSLQFDFMNREIQSLRNIKSGLKAIEKPQDALTRISQLTGSLRPDFENYLQFGRQLANVFVEAQASLCSTVNTGLLKEDVPKKITAKPTEKSVDVAGEKKSPPVIALKLTTQPEATKAASAKAAVKSTPPSKPAPAKAFPKSVFVQPTPKAALTVPTVSVKTPENAILKPVITGKPVESEPKSALAIVKAAEAVPVGATAPSVKPAKK